MLLHGTVNHEDVMMNMMRQPSSSAHQRTALLLLLTWLLLLLCGIRGVHTSIDNAATATASVEQNDCFSAESTTDKTGGNTMMQNDGGECGCIISAGDDTYGTAPVSSLLDTNRHHQQQQQRQRHDTVQEDHKEEEVGEMNIKEMQKLNLHKLIYDLGQGPETTWVYYKKDNPVEDMRRQTMPPLQLSTIDEETQMSAVRLCKFYNLSNRTLYLILKHVEQDAPPFELIKKYNSMMASGVACQIGQEFLFLDLADPRVPVAEFVVPPIDAHESQGAFLFAHDDYAQHHDTNRLATILSAPLLYEQYVLFQKTLAFDKVYRNATGGRVFLSNIGRSRPVYPLWEANHVGQTHRVATMDINQQEIFLTLIVMSMSPRILKIPNFLSLPEVQHIMTMARNKGMSPSETLGQSQRHAHTSSSSSTKTRTSQTTWLSHDHSPMLHIIYQRAADVLQIPHDIFRNVVAENLQVLYYSENAEYKAHYDFGFPPINHPQQPTRFATLLIYLNDEHVEGGETAFPRADLVPEPRPDESNHQTIQNMTNNSSAKAMFFKQKPETGTAILFYSMLPDGNMDERSLHAALPVMRGEKYLCNLWVWDPVADLVGLQ
jgi:prolyl 4-hydroxylase